MSGVCVSMFFLVVLKEPIMLLVFVGDFILLFWFTWNWK